jgi:hypothetical protein
MRRVHHQRGIATTIETALNYRREIMKIVRAQKKFAARRLDNIGTHQTTLWRGKQCRLRVSKQSRELQLKKKKKKKDSTRAPRRLGMREQSFATKNGD